MIDYKKVTLHRQFNTNNDNHLHTKFFKIFKLKCSEIVGQGLVYHA